VTVVYGTFEGSICSRSSDPLLSMATRNRREPHPSIPRSWRNLAWCESDTANCRAPFLPTTVPHSGISQFRIDAGGRLLPGSTVDDLDGDGSGAMRMDYAPESRVLVTRAPRWIDTRGAWESLEAIGGEVSRRPVEGVLFDVCNSEYVPAEADAHAFAAYLIAFLGRRRLAFLTRSVIQYGMARMIAADARAHGISVRVFQDEEQAGSWLCSCDTR
jgi:hypothetical protein